LEEFGRNKSRKVFEGVSNFKMGFQQELTYVKKNWNLVLNVWAQYFKVNLHKFR